MKPARYNDRNLGHAGLGSSRLRPLHLADPPLSGSRRPPGAARGGRRRGGGTEPPRGRAVGRALLRPRARLDEGRARRRRHLPRLPAQAGALRARTGAALRGRGLRRHRRRGLRRFGGEMSDAYEGFLPGAPDRGDHYELNDTDSALVGVAHRTPARLRRPGRGRVESVEAAARPGDPGAAVGKRQSGRGARPGGRKGQTRRQGQAARGRQRQGRTERRRQAGRQGQAEQRRAKHGGKGGAGAARASRARKAQAGRRRATRLAARPTPAEGEGDEQEARGRRARPPTSRPTARRGTST